jgi:hypothetical protein
VTSFDSCFREWARAAWAEWSYPEPDDRHYLEALARLSPGLRTLLTAGLHDGRIISPGANVHAGRPGPRQRPVRLVHALRASPAAESELGVLRPGGRVRPTLPACASSGPDRDLRRWPDGCRVVPGGSAPGLRRGKGAQPAPRSLAVEPRRTRRRHMVVVRIGEHDVGLHAARRIAARVNRRLLSHLSAKPQSRAPRHEGSHSRRPRSCDTAVPQTD